MAKDVTVRKLFRFLPRQSAVVIKARSNVGPITFVTGSINGEIGIEVSDGVIVLDDNISARLEIPLGTLTSGNVLYDAEILRRVDARRFPLAVVELISLSRIGSTNGYELSGTVTMHGVTRPIEGTVSAEFPTPSTIVVTGEQVVDIREFELVVPSTFMLKIYPDVWIEMHLEAEA
ncbi:MAG TPA: YceI family protein [Acidimicrobiales bacterium]|nr:YceI family protein [Acidimicrobiales bacterium]